MEILALCVFWLFIGQQRFAKANPPIIHYSHNMRILKIPHITEVGTIVYRIKASDADHDDVVFDILEDYGRDILRFEKINHREANVVLNSRLQESAEYNLTIYATDHNESTYIESRLIATSVDGYKPEDVNPIILEQNPIYVDENESLNKSLTIVRASDREDSKLPVTFELLENADIFDFHYIFGPRGMSTAEIVLINYLNYEQQNLFVLTLVTINAKTNKEIDTRNVHTIRLAVVVGDVQDTPPIFHNLPNLLNLDSSYRINDIIYRVNAEDGDTVGKRNITFALEKPGNQFFQVHSNGSIWPTVPYETLRLMYADVATPIELQIRANEMVAVEEAFNDHSMVSSTSHLILVFAEHNQTPYFFDSSLTGNINEHSGVMTAVTWPTPYTAHAFDPDFGSNGTIEFHVIDPSGTFIIEPKKAYRNVSFSLLVNNSELLDYEKRTNLTVIILVTDNSREMPLAANITCTILINDINDNGPQFTESVFRGTVYEDAKEGTVIARITATDKDSGDFGQVRYTSIKGSFAANLMLDFIDGTVTLINNRDIDRESIEEFWITVEARDNLGTGNSNSTLLHVQILDVNDNPPVFLQPNYLALVRTDLSSFIHPLQLTAIDIDELNTTNSVVNYEILHGNYENIFQLNKVTGELTMSGDRHRMVRSNPMEMTIRAYDLGIPQMSSTTKVFVYSLNPPSTVRTLFVTNHKLNLQQGNSSIERNLSYLTGGNVTIHEFIPLEKTKQIAVVGSVRYSNQTTVDLDKVPTVYRNLIDYPNINNEISMSNIGTKVTEKMLDRIESRESRNLQLEPAREEAAMEKKWLPASSFPSATLSTIRSIRLSEYGHLGILIWIFIVLIIILIIFLIYLLCLLCKRKRYSRSKKANIEQVERSTTQGGGKPKRNRKLNRRIRANNNKIVSLNTNTKEVEVKSSEQIPDYSSSSHVEYEVEEETKYSTTPTVVTYYECKRLRCPKFEDQDRFFRSQETTLPNATLPTPTEPKVLFESSQTQAITSGASRLMIKDIEESNTEKAANQKTPVTFESNLTEFNETEFKKLELDDHEEVKNKNMQRKSIFSITYDKINSRQNISTSESEKAL